MPCVHLLLCLLKHFVVSIQNFCAYIYLIIHIKEWVSSFKNRVNNSTRKKSTQSQVSLNCLLSSLMWTGWIMSPSTFHCLCATASSVGCRGVEQSISDLVLAVAFSNYLFAVLQWILNASRTNHPPTPLCHTLAVSQQVIYPQLQNCFISLSYLFLGLSFSLHKSCCYIAWGKYSHLFSTFLSCYKHKLWCISWLKLIFLA